MGPTRHLTEGLYDLVVTTELAAALKGLNGISSQTTGALDPAEAHLVLGDHLARVIRRALQGVPEKERPSAQANVVNRLLAMAAADLDDADLEREAVSMPASMLSAISSIGREPPPAPLIPLRDSALLVNARHEPRIGDELRRELMSADRVDLLCAFIKWYGVRVIEESLDAFLRAGRRLRVITTTYMAATEPRPLQWLVDRGAEVRVSYDSDVTRLHAKAWLFHRNSGFSTAYVGSSNLSRSALLDGVEWNVRLAEAETPHLLEKFEATFESYWNDPTFEPYNAARLKEALRLEHASPEERTQFALLDVTALPHQRDILGALRVERDRHGRMRNLIVAATGTGKTVIAALDYAHLKRTLPSARLLFIAHRKELLGQSLRTFRAVMKDGSFGELFVDGHRPEEWTHVFASVQSLTASGVERIDPKAFDVVIVDEFHHAASDTYDALLKHLQPEVLLGLTATPERSDGKDITHWFGGRIAAELRLWDALERGLLAPFQYFGVHDDIDLSGVRWSRGTYERASLERVYTGNNARVAKVLAQIERRVPTIARMRALGFCVSIAHAKFMAEQFRLVGIPSAAISAENPASERDAVLRRLRDRELNVVFAVDLFNEGVDGPEIDTVLFLRPTESATVFLQQLGRGLRRAPDKPCLTVLDFIGQHRQEFRFAPRMAAMVGCQVSEVAHHVEEGFPFLPSGCHIELDRVSTRIVLENLKSTILRTAALTAELRRLGDVDLQTFLTHTSMTPTELYRNGRSFTSLRREAGYLPDSEAIRSDEASLARGLERLFHVDDSERCAYYREVLSGDAPPDLATCSTRQLRLLRMLHFDLRATQQWRTLEASLASLWKHDALRLEIVALLGVLDLAATTTTTPFTALPDVPLRIHGSYSRLNVLAAVDEMTVENPYSHVAGVAWAKKVGADCFFVTLKKSERDFSPKTMSRDYAISPTLFHWESQSTTALTSSTGRRYVSGDRETSKVLLFVRQTKADPFVFLGPCSYVSHQGERPIAIAWRLEHEIPSAVLREARVAA